MAITGTEHPFPNPTGSMILQSTIPIFFYESVDSTNVKPRMAVESKGGTTSNADAKQLIVGSENSKRIMGWVTYGKFNKMVLSENNAHPTIDTAFAANDTIEIAMRIPACEAILTTGQGTLYPGQRYVCAGDGLLKAHEDSLVATTTAATTHYLTTSAPMVLDPTVAIGLSLVSTLDSTQVIQILPLW